MSYVREDGLHLERPVTMEDMKAFHRQCRHCYGSFEVAVHVRSGVRELKPCRVGLLEFAVATRGRVAEGPGGDTWWLTCAAPEQWSFTLMWIDDRIAWICDRALALKSHQWAEMQAARRKVRARLCGKEAPPQVAPPGLLCTEPPGHEATKPHQNGPTRWLDKPIVLGNAQPREEFGP
jgi:hypothetical protein